MKKLICIFLLVLTVFSACIPTFAASTVQRIDREANALYGFDDDTTAALLKKLRSKSKTLGMGLAVYATIIDDINEDSSYSDSQTYAQWVVDAENLAIKDNVAVLFVMYNENKFKLHVSGKGEELFTNEIKRYAQNRFDALFEETQDYKAVFEDYIDFCVELDNLYKAGETYEVPKPDHPYRICDTAQLLTDTEYEKLKEKADSVSKQYEFDIVIVTIGSLGGRPSWNYAHDYFIDNGYGLGENKDGIMLLIAIGTGREGERDWATYTSYGYSDALFDDSALSDIEDDVLNYLRPSDWYNAFDTFITRCEKRLSNGGGIKKDMDDSYYEDIFVKYEKRKDYMLYMPFLPTIDGIWLIIAAVLGIIISFIILAVMKSKMKSVQFNPDARNYVVNGSFRLTHSSDVFLYRNVVRTVRADNNSSSGGGGGFGGGGGHSSGGGHSGKF